MNEVRARIRCSGTFHTIGIDRDGMPFAAHHSREEMEAARVAEQIGGVQVDVPCVRMLAEIEECLRRKSSPPSDMPRAILDFLLRRRAQAVVELRDRQRYLERRVKRVMRQAELAAKGDLSCLEDILEGVEDEIYDRFHGEGTNVLLDVFTEAEARIMHRRQDFDLRNFESV
jgi:hypothetical protein